MKHGLANLAGFVLVAARENEQELVEAKAVEVVEAGEGICVAAPHRAREGLDVGCGGHRAGLRVHSFAPAGSRQQPTGRSEPGGLTAVAALPSSHGNMPG